MFAGGARFACSEKITFGFVENSTIKELNLAWKNCELEYWKAYCVLSDDHKNCRPESSHETLMLTGGYCLNVDENGKIYYEESLCQKAYDFYSNNK